MAGTQGALNTAVLAALDGLLRALDLEAQGDSRFRAHNEPDRFGRVFGGQMIAQAMQAASVTVSDKPPHSVHAYFVKSGLPDRPLDVEVDQVRDGRSMAARRVTVGQGDETLLIAMVSFHDNPTEPEFAEPVALVPDPGEWPLLQDWVDDAPPGLRERAQMWIDRPPPLEIRIGEPTRFFGGPRAPGPRTHWMRLPRDVGDDPRLHSVLLAYASDYLLLDMALRSHPVDVTVASATSFSVDHAIWLHRPIRFDEWHRYTQELIAVSGDRGLVRGAIHTRDGHLVANVTQEVLVRVRS
ncbi:MAG: acyl-CoA thioesterase [Mycobacterium sp.]|jgi:acyl-CoA thioesterase-2|nr:acyl-CoA thioesterase [Mycobacterium sp.]